MIALTVYSRPGCHLCDEMKAVVARVVRELETQVTIDEVDIYHPQPYYNPAELGKRILTAEFLERLWRVLRPGGRLLLQTDNKAYWKYLLQAVAKHFDPEILAGPWPDAPGGRTRREIIARRKGLVIWRMLARRREAPLDVAVPPHDFDANRPRFRKEQGRR